MREASKSRNPPAAAFLVSTTAPPKASLEKIPNVSLAKTPNLPPASKFGDNLIWQVGGICVPSERKNTQPPGIIPPICQGHTYEYKQVSNVSLAPRHFVAPRGGEGECVRASAFGCSLRKSMIFSAHAPRSFMHLALLGRSKKASS
jgi:hypothetical protein